jgi:hypothetical protein
MLYRNSSTDIWQVNLGIVSVYYLGNKMQERIMDWGGGVYHACGGLKIITYKSLAGEP